MRRVVIGRRSRHACRHSKPNPNLSKLASCMLGRGYTVRAWLGGAWGLCM